ncbi:transcription initiation factor TFIID subunit 2-like [Paramacrobiotus metropolitanus]|uniref:transcription initiation factor TFIID subunit 2-like n=1 Tax=Paramacrobiotus metropolitanus TaxID=2943436 RepID=UPI002445E9A0|nr:transcription initiation factor TFIID subunit 2-like [Paramacrobiotus metropolitanus]
MDKDKSKKPLEKSKGFRLIHQVLSVVHIDFAKECLVAYTELHIKLLNAEQKIIRLNSKQCRIFNVTINGNADAEFTLFDPTLDVCQSDTKKRNLEHFSNCHASSVRMVDAEYGGGELAITLPSRYAPSYTLSSGPSTTRSHAHDLIIVGIEFMLEKPAYGLHFVVPQFPHDNAELSMAQRGAYLVSGSHENSSRLWFPCVDSFSELCTWKLEITVPHEMIAVACGEASEIQITPDNKQKIFHFTMNIPTSAPQIALAVGPFEFYMDPGRNEMVHYCLPKLLPLLKHSISFLHQSFEFCEEYLACGYPYPVYKQVFVDETFADIMSYASMSVINCSFLFPKSVIEMNIPSRSIMALGACRQFFGMYLTPASWNDLWIVNGVAQYLHGLYYKKYFGNNEYRFQMYQQMKELTAFERDVHPVILVPPAELPAHFHFSPRNPQTCSEEYIRIYSIKAHLVVRMLEERIGAQVLAQVCNKILSLAAVAAASPEYPSWTGLLLSTEDFAKSINAVTANSIQPFMDKWVLAGGHARFKGRFSFNRKRNAIEMELSQEIGSKGCTSYVGPLPIVLQELDGSSKHTAQIEENSSKYDLVCHSKTRRYKKKKIPLWTGEEIDIMTLPDVTIDADCPVLWIRIDPDMTIIRNITFEQPDYHLHYIVRHERDVVSQLFALDALNNFPMDEKLQRTTMAVLSTVVEDQKIFYRIRLAAADALSRLSNKLALSGAPWINPPPMSRMYKSLFFVRLPTTVTHNTSNIVKRNDFHHFIRYYIQKNVPIYMAKLRNPVNVCPPEIVNMLLDMWKYNENKRNFYSDSYYRASLIEAFGETFSEVAGTLSVSEDPKFQFEQLSNLSKQCMENIFRALNQEKLLPSYQFVITVSCLNAIRNMHKHGVLPADWCVKTYKDYTDGKLYRPVRIAAYQHLVDHLKTTAKNSPNADLFDYLLTAAATDYDVFMRHKILRLMISNPPFTADAAKPEDCALSSENLVERLWKWMNNETPYDARLRCDIVDLYNVLYGKRRPACVPIPDLGMVLNLKERKAVLSDAAMATLEEENLADKAALNPEKPASPVKIKEEVPEDVPGPSKDVSVDLDRDKGAESIFNPASPYHPKIKFRVGDSSNAPSPSDRSPTVKMEEEEEQHRKKKKKHKHKHHHAKHKKSEREESSGIK